jgi:hypothetical protein
MLTAAVYSAGGVRVPADHTWIHHTLVQYYVSEGVFVTLKKMVLRIRLGESESEHWIMRVQYAYITQLRKRGYALMIHADIDTHRVHHAQLSSMAFFYNRKYDHGSSIL